MKTFLCLIVLFAVVHINKAGLMGSDPSTHPDFPNQCYVESKQKGYTVGEHTPIGDCVRISCHSDYSYVIATCGLFVPPEGYHNERDLTKPYPDCCHNFVKN